MDSPSTPTTEASPRVYYSRFSLDDINITSSTTYEIHETDSFIYNPSFASSETSIASYKTERTINSRKSRYNTLPRRKYAGIGIPHGLVSLGVDAVETSSRQHPSAEVTSLRKQLCAEMRPKLATLVEYMYGFNTSQAHASIIYNARRAQELLRDRNFIYPEPRTGHDPYRHPIIQRAIDTTWFRNKDDIGVADHEYFSPMPVSVIAITLTVIEYYIDEWSYGTRRNSSWDDAKFQTVYDSHVSSFLNFQERGPASDRDVLYQLQCDLLRNAREHAGVIDSSDPRVIEENTIFAREMKSGLGSNWGFPSDPLMDGMLDYVAKWSQLKQEKRGNKRLDEARTLNKPATAGGILVDRMLGYVAKHTPSEQEKRGDRWLEDAYSLTAEYRPLINSRHLEEIEEKRQYARNIKSGLDSRRGRSRFSYVREYVKAAKSAYETAKTVSETSRDEAYFTAQRPDTSSVSGLLNFDISQIIESGHRDSLREREEMSDRERATGIALSLCRIYLSCKDAFPTAQMKEEWAAIVWRDACVKTGASLELFIPFELFADGNMKSFVDTKTRIMHVVEAQYGFDTSHAPDSISRNATLSQALLSDMAFVYRELNPGGSPHHPYRHPALQKAINITWFRDKEDDGVIYHEYFSPVSVPAIAFILAVVECCIDEWTNGTRKETEWDEKRFKTVYQSHISSLNDFWQHSINQGADLFEHIRSDLLKEARKHAGVPPVPVTELGRFSQDALDATPREDLPAHPDQGLQVPRIIIYDDSEE